VKTRTKLIEQLIQKDPTFKPPPGAHALLACCTAIIFIELSADVRVSWPAPPRHDLVTGWCSSCRPAGSGFVWIRQPWDIACIAG